MQAYGAAAKELKGTDSRWTNGNWKPRAIGSYTKMEGEKYRKDSADFNDHMYKWSDGTWRVGQNDKDHGWVKSVGSAACPENIRQWQFFDRETQWKYLNGDITVQCS